MTNKLIERAKAALENAKPVVADVKHTEVFHTRNAATDRNCRYWFVEHGDTLIDLARALIREREAADVDLIEQAISDVLSEGGTYREAAEYVVRTIRQETDDV